MTTAEVAATPSSPDSRAADASCARPQGEKCVTVIFNPVSGQGDPEERKQRIRQALAEHGYRCQALITTPEQGASYWAAKALEEGVDLLAVSGGDGTVIETMSALVGTGIPIAIFPSGTGNLLSVNLGLPKDVPQAVHAALFGERRRLDLARIYPLDPPGKPLYCAIMAGVGYDAWVIRDADRQAKKRLGMAAYFWSALKNLRHRSVVASVRLDGQSLRLRRRAKGVMVANMGRILGDVKIVPDAWPDDGVLDVAILRAESLRSWAGLIVSAVLHRLRQDTAIEYHKAKRIEIALSRPQPMQYDGEVKPTLVRAFAVEVVPQAVEVMVPKAAPV